MAQPPGFNDGSGQVLNLRKSIYGLKQAEHVWNQKFDSGMKKLDFQQLLSNYCVYI
jgi:Reverse transcriptase (RNA-dependent DNA polymerase)